MNSISTLISKLDVEELARRIDHALLKPWVTRRDVEKAVEELEELKLRCLITTPPIAREIASTTKGCVGAVVGFPYGYTTLESKVKELEDVIAYGVSEVDLVLNHQLYSIGKRDLFEAEAKAVITICKEVDVICKVIIEAVAYDKPVVEEMVRIVAKYSPNYVKTSSGYGPRPTYPEDVLHIRSLLDRLGYNNIGVKAAGGIRTAIQALTMISSGAAIIGTSTPRQIIEGFRELKRGLA